MKRGWRFFPGKTFIGGLSNHNGVLVDGSEEELRLELQKIVAEMKGKKFILGADCTLASDFPYERIRFVVETVRNIS